MKGAVFHGPPGAWPREPMRVEEVLQPFPGPGDVLVRVAACGICRTDLEYLKEGIRPPKEFPLILGHEISGIVAEVGGEAAAFQPGQRVLVNVAVTCGLCSYCRSGRDNLCVKGEIIGASRDGGFAQYVVVPARSLFPLPDSLPLEESAIITDAIATPYHALVNVAGVKPGDVVAIYGASGGLGLSSTQIATSLGATVIAIGRQPWKLKRSRELGAAKIISTEEVKEVDREVNRLTQGGVDISLDLTGLPALITAACKSTRPGGKIVVVSFTFHKVEVALNRLMWLEHSILGSRNYCAIDLPRVIKMVERGMVDLHKIISHRFPLEEINEAYAMLEQGEVLRGIVLAEG